MSSLLMFISILVFNTLDLTSCSDYKLNLILHSYQNSHHRLYHGRCCDSPSFTACHLHQCYNTFLFCYSLEHHSVASIDNYVLNMRLDKPSCPDGWDSYTTGLIGYWLDNVTFPVEGHWISEKERLRNPLIVTGNGCPGWFQLFVVVVHSRTVNKELVDILSHSWQLAAGDKLPSVQVTSAIGGSAYLNVSLQVVGESASESNCDLLITPADVHIGGLGDTTLIVAGEGLKVNKEMSTNTSHESIVVLVVSSVGGSLGLLLVVGLTITFIVVLFVVCKMRRDRRSQGTEVAALCNGPGDNPTYMGVVSNGNNMHSDHNHSLQFTNSLYGTITPENMSQASHTIYSIPPSVSSSHSSLSNSNPAHVPGTSQSFEQSSGKYAYLDVPKATVVSHDSGAASQPPIESQYSVVSHDYAKVLSSHSNCSAEVGTNSFIDRDNGNCPQHWHTDTSEGVKSIDPQEQVESQYSVITRENLVEGYSVINRENVCSDGSDLEGSCCNSYSEPFESESDGEGEAAEESRLLADKD